MEVLLRRHPGLAGFPHVDLGVRPTPVEEREIAGLPVLVKRDDLAGPVYGGNKVRSLEFLLAQRPSRVLTFSTLEAHHAYATAVHARRIGAETDAVIVRRGSAGALLRTLPCVCRRHRVVRGTPGAILAMLGLWRRGTLLLPPGGMSPRGALGYLVAALEIDPVPTRIYAPLGSGTTVSGLLAGLMLRSARAEVVAVRVADAMAGVPCLLWLRAFRALSLLRRFDPSVPRVGRGEVRLRVVAAAGAYGEATPTARDAVEAARPLLLEPTYTGKTLEVLLEERAEGALFLNTYAGPIG